MTLLQICVFTLAFKIGNSMETNKMDKVVNSQIEQVNYAKNLTIFFIVQNDGNDQNYRLT